MNSIKLLKEQFKVAHEFLEGTMQEVDDSVAHKMPAGKAHNIASLYAHLFASEDMLLNSVLQGKPSFFATNWAEKTGMSEMMPQPDQNWEQNFKDWAGRVKIDLAAIKEYRSAVNQALEDYIGNLREVDLDREVDLTAMGMGKVNVAWILSNLIIAHINNVTGEISALKGTQGLKGYPF